MKYSKYYTRIKNFRTARRNICVLAMGGKCQICGYEKCRNALEVHHIVSEDKEISFQKIVSWDRIYDELDKCILLCSNCHREVHENVTELPLKYFKFDRDIADSLRTKHSHAMQRSKREETFEERKALQERQNRESKERRYNFINERKILIRESKIDLNEWGWSVKVGNLLGISSQKAGVWVKTHMKIV